jgi:DNA/RNA-binding domain of Phe-tRNA-synthetase-like protein
MDSGICFRLDPEVAAKFPETQIRFVVARGLHNDTSWDEVSQLLSDMEEKVAENTWQPFGEESLEIASWHNAYRSFGTNPRRIRPSVDALSRRLTRNGKLPRINPAVNAYNFISVRYGSPAGAFDLNNINGLVLIRFAGEGDEFTPLGEPDERETATPGEVVYAQGSRVLTRHWNHRDADQTKVTEQSTDVVFMIERVSAQAVPDDRMAEAQNALADLIRPHADEVITATVEPRTPEYDIETEIGTGTRHSLA